MYEETGELLSSIKNANVYKPSVETLELKPIEELVKSDVNMKEHFKSKIDIGTKAKTLFHRTLLSNDAKK